MRDLYSILGIQKDADQASIRKAYKQLARKYHPDLNKEPGADERFKEVNTAYEVLSDEQRRSHYDNFGAESLKQGFNPEAARQWRQATGGASGFGGGFGGGGFGGGVDIDDLLNAFGGRFRGGPQRQAPPRQQKGPDIEQALSCTIEELLSGDKKMVVVRRPSPAVIAVVVAAQESTHAPPARAPVERRWATCTSLVSRAPAQATASRWSVEPAKELDVP